MASSEPSSDADDAAWRAWAASRSTADAEEARRVRLLTALGVAGLVVATVALRFFLSDFGVRKLGDEAELRVVFLGTDHSKGNARVGVTPLKVRKGTPADLVGWRLAGTEGPVPAGVPNYVDVRLVNKGNVALRATIGVSAYDEGDRPLEVLELVRPDSRGAQFPLCHGPAERAQVQPGDSATTCIIFNVPQGATLDRLSAGGGIGKATNWAVK